MDCLPPSSSSSIATVIGTILDDFHNAASCGDYNRYFNHFTSDAIFLGADPHERWNISQFKEYAVPRFHKEKVEEVDGRIVQSPMDEM
jgi:hypothetical protein